MIEIFSSAPTSSPELYTYITLDGVRPPGIWRRTSGGDRTQQEQDQQAPGFAGGFTTFRAEDIPKLDYEVTVLDRSSYLALESFAGKMLIGARKRPPASYRFADPWLRSQRILTVAVISIGPIGQPEKGVQRFTQTYKFTVYQKMMPIGGAVNPEPTSVLEDLIARVTADSKDMSRILGENEKAVNAARDMGK